MPQLFVKGLSGLNYTVNASAGDPVSSVCDVIAGIEGTEDISVFTMAGVDVTKMTSVSAEEMDGATINVTAFLFGGKVSRSLKCDQYFASL